MALSLSSHALSTNFSALSSHPSAVSTYLAAVSIYLSISSLFLSLCLTTFCISLNRYLSIYLSIYLALSLSLAIYPIPFLSSPLFTLYLSSGRHSISALADISLSPQNLYRRAHSLYLTAPFQLTALLLTATATDSMICDLRKEFSE
eukprot:1357237-Amorphochlora_amoeboformis.AAC.1